MYIGMYYILARNNTLKLFTGINNNDLIVLDLLHRQGGPVHYMRLYGLIHEQGHTVHYKAFTTILKRCIEGKLISRTQVAGNVLYAITMDGKRLLYRFCEELNNIVAQDVRKYGNGFTDH